MKLLIFAVLVAFSNLLQAANSSLLTCAGLISHAAVSRLQENGPCKNCQTEFTTALAPTNNEIRHVALTFLSEKLVEPGLIKSLIADAKNAGVEIFENGNSYTPYLQKDSRQPAVLVTLMASGTKASLNEFVTRDIPDMFKLVTFDFHDFDPEYLEYQRGNSSFMSIHDYEDRLYNFWKLMAYQHDKILIVADLPGRSYFAVLRSQNENELRYLDQTPAIVDIDYETFEKNWASLTRDVTANKYILRVTRESSKPGYATQVNYIISLETAAELNSARERIYVLRKQITDRHAALAKASASEIVAPPAVEKPSATDTNEPAFVASKEVSLNDFVLKRSSIMKPNKAADFTRGNRRTFRISKRNQPMFVAYDADWLKTHFDEGGSGMVTDAYFKAAKKDFAQANDEALRYFSSRYSAYRTYSLGNTRKGVVVKSLSDINSVTGFTILNSAYDKDQVLVLKQLKTEGEKEVFVLIPIKD